MLSHTPYRPRRLLHDTAEVALVAIGACLLSGPFGILLIGYLTH